MRYRAEVDGLRAIAISSVLIFHFFPNSLPLGYLGVDLFFVISGFLISTYIIEETKNNSFSFKVFYYRRIKRILPATITVLFVTTLLSSFYLTPPDLIRYTQSLISTLTFTANIYFWRDGGYFGSSDELKPLLHMWSLGVEEQFYLFFPLFIFVILKFIRRTPTLFVTVLLISILSLLLNIYLLRIGGDNPAFFLLPTRVWQFGLGVLAAIHYLNNNSEHKSYHSFTALALIIISTLIAIPSLPAGFVITAAASYFLAKRYNKESFASVFLLNKYVIKIGLISFSLYLWHWPVIVFIKYYAVNEPSYIILYLGVFVTILLSLASYRFIEQPFRKDLSKKNVYYTLSASTLFLIIVSASIIYTDGIRSKESNFVNIIADATQTNYRCPISDYIPYGSSRACYINKTIEGSYDFALVGNSHAQMYVPSIQRLLLSERRKGLLIPLNGCLPTIDLNISPQCLKLANDNYNALMADANIKTVIFSMTWYSDYWFLTDGSKIDDPDKLILTKSLLNLISKVENSGRKVFLVGPIEIPNFDLPSILSRNLAFGHISTDAALLSLKVPRHLFDKKFKKALLALSASLGNRLILPHHLLCDSRFCYFGDEKEIYFSDSSHLSLIGAKKMEPIFSAALNSSLISNGAPEVSSSHYTLNTSALRQIDKLMFQRLNIRLNSGH